MGKRKRFQIFALQICGRLHDLAAILRRIFQGASESELFPSFVEQRLHESQAVAIGKCQRFAHVERGIRIDRRILPIGDVLLQRLNEGGHGQNCLPGIFQQIIDQHCHTLAFHQRLAGSLLFVAFYIFGILVRRR